MENDVVVTISNDPSSLPMKFSKQEVAVDRKLQDKRAVVGMEVLARFGSDVNGRPVYGLGMITSKVRPSQYTVKPSCTMKAMPLGVGTKLPVNRVKKIPDGQMRASSEYEGYPARKGRLGNGKVWCPTRQGARNAWLQVDLGAPYYLCSVVAQGDTERGTEWTKTYAIAVSNDGGKFTYLQQDNGDGKDKEKHFTASRDGTESKVEIKIPYRYIRFSPRTYNKFPCLGVEVEGIGPAQSTKASQEFNVGELRPLGDPLVPYLLVPNTWKGRVDWRQARYITHRGGDVYVKTFPGSPAPVQFSSGDVILNVPSKSDSLHVGGAVFAPFSKDKDGAVMYSAGRVDFEQNGQYMINPLCSRVQKSLPIGVGIPSTLPLDRVTSLPDSHFSATSEHIPTHAAKQGRHGNALVWCAAIDKLRSSTLLIDLGGLYHICSVLVQGNTNGAKDFVTSFKISMSTNGRSWKFIQDPKGREIFQRSGSEPAEIHLGVKTAYKHVMFTPIEYNNRPCMGVELYGIGPLAKSSTMFTPRELRMQGSICELEHECPPSTKCILGSVPGIYSCECPQGYMSSSGGNSIKPGTDQHCRSINPTGKVMVMRVEALPRRSGSRAAYKGSVVKLVTLITFVAVTCIACALH